MTPIRFQHSTRNGAPAWARPDPRITSVIDFAVDFGVVATSERCSLFRVNTAFPNPVTVDLDAGVSRGPMPGWGETYAPEEIVGTARAVPVGQDVVINCSTTDAGKLFIEESPDGITWGGSGALYGLDADEHEAGLITTAGLVHPDGGVNLHDSQTVGVRFRADEPHYRTRFVVAGGDSARNVHVCSQVREPGA